LLRRFTDKGKFELFLQRLSFNQCHFPNDKCLEDLSSFGQQVDSIHDIEITHAQLGDTAFNALSMLYEQEDDRKFSINFEGNLLSLTKLQDLCHQGNINNTAVKIQVPINTSEELDLALTMLEHRTNHDLMIDVTLEVAVEIKLNRPINLHNVILTLYSKDSANIDPRFKLNQPKDHTPQLTLIAEESITMDRTCVINNIDALHLQAKSLYINGQILCNIVATAKEALFVNGKCLGENVILSANELIGFGADSQVNVASLVAGCNQGNIVFDGQCQSQQLTLIAKQDVTFLPTSKITTANLTKQSTNYYCHGELNIIKNHDSPDKMRQLFPAFFAT
jgi:hypothetical protein